MSRPITRLERMAGTTRLELATSAVTGQRSNQLNYVPKTSYRKTLWDKALQVSHPARTITAYARNGSCPCQYHRSIA